MTPTIQPVRRGIPGRIVPDIIVAVDDDDTILLPQTAAAFAWLAEHLGEWETDELIARAIEEGFIVRYR